MANFVRKNLDFQASFIGGDIAYGGLIGVVAYGYGLIDGDAGAVASAVGFWAAVYALYAPFFVRSIVIREPPEDPWRAAAFVGWGALPFFPFIPFWSELTAWPVSIAAFPAVVLWSCAALFLAGLGRWPQGGRARRILLASGGAILGVAAGPVYLGFVYAAFTGQWTPPDGEVVVATLAMLGGLPMAGLAAYAAVELLGRANRADEPSDQPT